MCDVEHMVICSRPRSQGKHVFQAPSLYFLLGLRIGSEFRMSRELVAGGQRLLALQSPLNSMGCSVMVLSFPMWRCPGHHPQRPNGPQPPGSGVHPKICWVRWACGLSVCLARVLSNTSQLKPGVAADPACDSSLKRLCPAGREHNCCACPSEWTAGPLGSPFVTWTV